MFVVCNPVSQEGRHAVGGKKLLSANKNVFRLFRRGKEKGTGETLPSPGEFRTILAHELARADRHGYQFSIIVFQLGTGGDNSELVEDLAKLVKSRVRLSDEIGWYAERELGVILTGTPTGGAWKFIGEIAKRINLATSHLTLKVYTYPSRWISEEEQNHFLSKNNPPTEEGRFDSKEVETFFACPMSIWKRLIDIVGSVIALIVLSPGILLIALGIKLSSPGPVIFKQERLGLMERRFNFLKFRSMCVNQEADLHRRYVEQFIKNGSAYEGQVYKIRDDPRVTSIGKFLRKTSLDELPQLINVLKGEMSLVGPRPPLPYECVYYDCWHTRRVLHVKPGITGLWQVKGRSRTTFDDMVRLDLKYSREWSLWLDFKILLQTPLAVLSGKGAY